MNAFCLYLHSVTVHLESGLFVYPKQLWSCVIAPISYVRVLWVGAGLFFILRCIYSVNIESGSCWYVRLIGALVLFQVLSSWILFFLMTSPFHPLHLEPKVPSLRMRRNPRYDVRVGTKRSQALWKEFKRKESAPESCWIHKNVRCPLNPLRWTSCENH